MRLLMIEIDQCPKTFPFIISRVASVPLQMFHYVYTQTAMPYETFFNMCH